MLGTGVKVVRLTSGVRTRVASVTLSNNVNDVKHWRDRAAEMRILSTMMEHVETQAIMARLADDYDKMADGADLLVREKVHQSARVGSQRRLGFLSWFSVVSKRLKQNLATTECLAHPDCRRSPPCRYTGRRSPPAVSSCDRTLPRLRDFEQLSEYRRDSNSRDLGLGRLCTSLLPSQLSLSRQAAALTSYSSLHRQ